MSDRVQPVIPPIVGQDDLSRILKGFSDRLLNLERNTDTVARHTMTSVSRASGVTGSIQYVVVSGICYVNVAVAFASTAAGTPVTLANAGALPSTAVPASLTWRTVGASGVVLVRVDISPTGAITAVPLSAAGDGANASIAYPVGI